MADNNKMKACRRCGEDIAKSAKYCPHCGARNRKRLKSFGLCVLVLVLVICVCNRERIWNVTPQPVKQSVLHVERTFSQVGSLCSKIILDCIPEKEKADGKATAGPEKTTEPEKTTAPETSGKKDKNGVSVEFKKAMDAYEAFFDEYAEFMKKYNKSDDATSMLLDYASFMSRYTETMNALDGIDEDKLSDADAAYYVKVMARINQKLVDVVAEMD